MSELPEGWITISTGELGSWRGGGTPSKANTAFWTDGTIPWVSPKDMKRPLIADADDKITAAALAGSATQLIPEDSILLVTRSGILQHSLPVAANTVPVAINQDLKALTPHDGIDTQFVRLQFQSDAQQILRECSKSGTTVESIDFDLLKKHRFRLAPLGEQRRIVARLDGLMARTARARADLVRIPMLIARYKSRLLALAFSGELIGHPGNWRSATIGDLADTQLGKMLDKAKNKGEPTKYLRNINVRWYGFEIDDVLEMPMSQEERQKFSIENGDILTCEGGEPGRSAIWSGGPTDLSFQKALIRIRPDIDALNPFYLVHYLKHLADTQELAKYFTGSTIKHLPQRALQSVEMLVPPIKEQAEILRHIESAFSWLDRITSDHLAATELLPKLDGAILAKAFCGELVPQDPSDAAAKLTLDAIRADQTGSPKRTRAGSLRRSASNAYAAPQLEASVPAVAVNRSQTGKIVIKKRHDPDVYGKPYLADILRNTARPCKVEVLQSASRLRVADFYKQLAWEIDQGLIRDGDDGFEVI